MGKITTAFLLFVLLAVNGANEVKQQQQQEPREICPFGWAKYERQCYKLFRIGKMWNEAEKLCLGNKGHLASVHTPGVNTLLNTLIQKHTNHIWIGGYYAAQKAVWAWSDGSNFDYTNWKIGKQVNQENQQKQETVKQQKPVIAEKNKICVLAEVTKGVLQWRVHPCTIRHYFVCQKGLPK